MTFKRLTSDENLFPVTPEEDEVVLHEVDENLAHQLAHVHATNHLLKDLLPGVDGHLVHVLVPFGSDKVQFSVVPEGAPLRVDACDPGP